MDHAQQPRPGEDNTNTISDSTKQKIETGICEEFKLFSPCEIPLQYNH